MRRPTLLAAALAAAVLAVLIPAPATAHPANWYFNGTRWPIGATVSYGLNAGFPSGDARYRVLDGKDQWMKVVGSNEPKVYWTLTDGRSYGVYNKPCELTSGNNTGIMFWNNLDAHGATILAIAYACGVSSTRTRVSIAFDSTTSWYTGTGDAPSGRYDMWAVASHEWGHALGFVNHLAEGEANVCPSYENVVRHTMCPKIFSAYETQRYLKTHDIHTFDYAY